MALKAAMGNHQTTERTAIGERARADSSWPGVMEIHEVVMGGEEESAHRRAAKVEEEKVAWWKASQRLSPREPQASGEN